MKRSFGSLKRCFNTSIRSRKMTTNILEKPRFYDMIHSNNAARIRLWIRFKELEEDIETVMVTYPILQSEEFARVNPLKKVPAIVVESGESFGESYCIQQYLEDKYAHKGKKFTPDNLEKRFLMNYLLRIHDLYIASPNCTQSNFAHTQGCMYLAPYETPHCSKVRTMDRPTRAAKLAEIDKQLTWLDGHLAEVSKEGPYLCGSQLTLADFAWFPTLIFMEYMLPRTFGWSDVIFQKEPANTCFPHVGKWFNHLLEEEPHFADVRQDIWDFWVQKDKDGQFDAIRNETLDNAYKWKYY